MDIREIDEILRRTLDDGHLTRSEERALRSVVRDLQPDEHQRGVLRSRVFELAEERLKQRDDRLLLEWVKKALQAVDSGVDAGDSCRADAVFSPGNQCLNRLRDLFRSSHGAVDICVFTITDDRVAGAILEAHTRGIPIRIITDDDKRHDQGSDVDRLAAAGVAVRTDRTPDHMHHKFALFDRKFVLTGSYNWTRAAARDNHENMVVVESREVVASFQKVFDDLWEQFSR